MNKELIKLAFTLGFQAAQNDMIEKQAAIPGAGFAKRIGSRYLELLAGGNKKLTSHYRDVMRARKNIYDLGFTDHNPHSTGEVLGKKFDDLKAMFDDAIRARRGKAIGEGIEYQLTPGRVARNAKGRLASRSSVASELRKSDLARVLTALGITGTGAGAVSAARSGKK